MWETIKNFFNKPITVLDYCVLFPLIKGLLNSFDETQNKRGQK